MLRLALTFRWLGLLALALLIATVFASLGQWQLNRAQQQTAEPEQLATQPLTDVFAPQAELDGTAARTPVIVTGTVDASRPALLVTDRRYQEQPVSWVVVPVIVEGSGAKLPVVLGVIPAGQPAPQVTPGTVRLQTWLQTSEDPAPPSPDGNFTSLGVPQLLNVWGAPLYSAFVFGDQATADTVAPGGAITALPVQPPEADATGYHLLNLSYALQWWVFAVFAVFIWWRLLQRAYADQQTQDIPDDTPQRQLT